MRRTIFILITGLLMLFLMSFMAVGAAEEEKTDAGSQLKYIICDGEAMITGYTVDPIGELIIPNMLGKYAVTSIGSLAFFGVIA
ncbi:MAG: hypothetical protein FWF47_02715 [Clostridia bacterium]|nr:hypothetical protein [Clostridia bacterium]